MYLPDGLLFYSPEATEARKRWGLLKDATKRLFESYQILLICCLKALFRDAWPDTVLHDPDQEWSTLDAISECCFQRSVLTTVGARPELFGLLSELKKLIVKEPKAIHERKRYCHLMKGVIDEFPFDSIHKLYDVPIPEVDHYLARIKRHAKLSESSVKLFNQEFKDNMEAFFKAWDAEVTRIHALNHEEYMDEKRQQVGIPEDVDPDHEWYFGIFHRGEDPEFHRKLTSFLMPLVNVRREIVKLREEGKKLLKRGRDWILATWKHGGAESTGEQGMDHLDRDDSSHGFTRSNESGLASIDSSHTSSSSSPSRRKRRAQDIEDPIETRSEALNTSPMRGKKTKNNKWSSI